MAVFQDDFEELDEIERIEIEELGETIPGDWAPKSTLTVPKFCDLEALLFTERKAFSPNLALLFAE